VRGGPKGTRTSYFYNGSFAPYGRTWGAPFMPRDTCPIYVPPVYCDPFSTPDPFASSAPCVPRPTDEPRTPRPFNTPKPKPTPKG
jgi:hypothetical protein